MLKLTINILMQLMFTLIYKTEESTINLKVMTKTTLFEQSVT